MRGEKIEAFEREKGKEKTDGEEQGGRRLRFLINITDISE